MELRYTSECYTGDRWQFWGRTLVAAFGDIDGEEYSYAEFINEDDCPPGTVPEAFKERAHETFAKTVERRRLEAGHG